MRKCLRLQAVRTPPSSPTDVDRASSCFPSPRRFVGNGRESLRSDRGIARKNSSFLLASQLSRRPRPETLVKRAIGAETSAWRLFRPRLHFACEQALSL